MTSMNPAVLAIAGPIESGKTTTATLLAQRLGWPHDGYGDTIRTIATARGGLPASRSILQQLGMELTGVDWSTFTRLVLITPGGHHGSRSSGTACATCPPPPPSARPSARSPASSTWTCPPAPPSPAPAAATRPPALAQ